MAKDGRATTKMRETGSFERAAAADAGSSGVEEQQNTVKGSRQYAQGWKTHRGRHESRVCRRVNGWEKKRNSIVWMFGCAPRASRDDCLGLCAIRPVQKNAPSGNAREGRGRREGGRGWVFYSGPGRGLDQTKAATFFVFGPAGAASARRPNRKVRTRPYAMAIGMAADCGAAVI